MLEWLSDLMFGLPRSELHRINDRLRFDKAAQVRRADLAEQEASVARRDTDAALAKLAIAERRIESQARALDDAATRYDKSKRERDAAVSEVSALAALMANARNQLDGRAHHDHIESAVFLPTYKPSVLM